MSGLGGAWQDVVCVIALIVSLPSRVTFRVVTSLDPGNHARQAPLRSLRRRTSPFMPVVREMVFPPASGANEIRTCGNGLSRIRQVAWAGAAKLNARKMPSHKGLRDDMRRAALNWSKSCRDRRLSDRLDVQRLAFRRVKDIARRLRHPVALHKALPPLHFPPGMQCGPRVFLFLILDPALAQRFASVLEQRCLPPGLRWKTVAPRSVQKVHHPTIRSPRASLPSASLSQKPMFSALPALPGYLMPDL